MIFVLPEHGPRYGSLISNAILEVLSYNNRDSLGHFIQKVHRYLVRVVTAINLAGRTRLHHVTDL